MKRIVSAIVLCALLSATGRSVEAQFVAPSGEPETAAQRDARMHWWREARFGMFIHWGVYSVPAGIYDGRPVRGIGEWIMNRGRIPVARYAQYTKQFDPVKFDADQWVSIAKNAGMKYIVITAKHHDGFAMFHSHVDSYNICDATPFHRDPLAELAAACKKQGIRLGFYYSQAQDWHHPGGAAAGGHWDKAQDGDMDQYLRNIAVPQVRELLSNYGPVAVLWFDTPVGMTKERVDLFRPLFPLQPGIIVNNRLGPGFKGDTETPEQRIPPTGYPGRDWETCMTINDTWGYKSNDTNFKSVETLLRNLCDIASKGGNYLLNVGPTSQGVIPQPEVDRIEAVGKWLRSNGQAIYGTSASPFRHLDFGRATRKGNTLYLLVFNWPADGVLHVPMTGSVSRASLLSDPNTALQTTSSDKGVEIHVPANAPDPIVSVVAVETTGDIHPLAVDASASPEADGSYRLDAADAQIVGSEAQLEEDHIGFWTDARDFGRWKLNVREPGQFTVRLEYACDPRSGGAEYSVVSGEQHLKGTVRPTRGWNNFRTVRVGSLTLDHPGPATLEVHADTKPGEGVMNLRAVILQPAK